ncbi:phage tail assembly chaperone GT [Pseudogracilibacillus auburnensis]|uniref:phage tail assembly chaperone GT n=1 Tax=Pseudogracilibacillus auburnensis TaxID=1494959 RepID=UPI003556E604
MKSMDKFARDLMKEGKDINEILDMPVHYVMEILKEKTEVKKANSFFDLLG